MAVTLQDSFAFLTLNLPFVFLPIRGSLLYFYFTHVKLKAAKC